VIPENAQDDWSPAVPPFDHETIIEDVVLSYPEPIIQRVFDELELHCFDCAVGPRDTLRDVARLHRQDEEQLIERLSTMLEDEDPLETPSYFGEGT